MRRLAAVLGLALATTGTGAMADDGDEDLDELRDEDALADVVPVSARARLVGATVTIAAHFELSVKGPLPPPGVQRSIPLPHDAVITAATVHAGGNARTLQLVKTEEVDKRFEALTGEPGPNGERMTAVRIDAHDTSDVANVEITVPKRTTVRLDLTLEVPTCFASDARNVSVPSGWERVLVGGTAITADAASELDDKCGSPNDGNSWIGLTDKTLARRAPGEQRIGTRAVRLPLDTADITRLEIALANELTTIPADLHTVLVVDHSVSVTPEQLEVQRGVVAAYLRAAPRSRVQLVSYTREAHTLLPGWMIAGHVTARVDRELAALAPRNGSNLDRGLGAAATLLASSTGTRRIIVFTDDAIPDRIEREIASYAPGLPAGTLVHVVSLAGFDARLVRDDSHELAPIAVATHGVVMRANLDDNGSIDALPLARPVGLDNLKITAPGWNELASGLGCPWEQPLGEGSSCAFLATGTSASGPITVEAWMWGTKVTRVVEPDRRDARSLARLLSRSDALPRELVPPVLAFAHAVNEAWSLMAMWGTGGYADLEGWGTIGIGRIGTHSSHTITDEIGTSKVVAPNDQLTAQLAPAVRACKPRGVIDANIELTQQEIVDVSITTRDGRDAVVRGCITDRMFDTLLALDEPPQHGTFAVAFQP